ncbi:amidase [Pararhodobacter sp.]|uniref:amidase n=1 Tax=Pararhodobacter sp. TaxID=2127056 RepID=UPI002AFFD20A|nr:amidase [Pararhodobacter sp.]
MTRPTTRFTGPDLCALSAREAVRLLKRKDLSPGDVLAAAEARIKQVEPQVNAVVIRAGARARQQLDSLAGFADQNTDEPGWLAGLPIAIKDLTLVSDLPATFGSAALKDQIATQSDPLVERLEARGGVIAGKTNTPEFGAGGNTWNAVFGQTRNPWNTARNAGGSSGGAAVSLATGEVWLSHGSDLAGSLRTPAALCGVVGLRPTPGRCGGGPAATAFAIEGISGPMARDTRDLALFLDAMAGYDPRQPISLEAPSVPFQTAIMAPDRHLRIAFAEDQNGFAPVEPEIRTVLRRAMEQVQSAGHGVDQACPDLPDLYRTYITLRGVHYGSINAYLPAHVQAAFKDTLRQNAETGRNLTTAQIYDAMRQRTVLYHIMRQFLERYDVLAIPVIGLEAGPAEQEYPLFVDGQPMLDYVDWLRFSFLATTTALPALSLPAGFTRSGMPVGVQLIGPPRGEATLLHAARQIEDILALPAQPIDPMPARPTG